MFELIGRLVGLDTSITQISEGFAVLLSATLVVVGWCVSSRQSAAVLRRENAHSYLIVTNENTKAKIKNLTYNLKNRIPVSASPDGSDAEVAAFLAARDLLTTLEIAAVDVRLGIASERYIVETQRSLIFNIIRISTKILTELRKNRGQSTVFVNIEIFYIRNFYRNLGLFLPIMEYILNRPLFSLSLSAFSVRYWVCRQYFALPDDHLQGDPRFVKKCLRDLNYVEVFLFSSIALGVILNGFSAFIS